MQGYTLQTFWQKKNLACAWTHQWLLITKFIAAFQSIKYQLLEEHHVSKNLSQSNKIDWHTSHFHSKMSRISVISDINNVLVELLERFNLTKEIWVSFLKEVNLKWGVCFKEQTHLNYLENNMMMIAHGLKWKSHRNGSSSRI